jgi:hypothetical protein
MLPRLALGLIALLAALPARADDVLQTDYRISLIGLPVGRAHFETRLSPTRYSVSGSLSSAGLAELVSSTRGTSSVSGRVRPDRLTAERYRLQYTSDKKSWRADVRFSGGRALSSDIAPPAPTPPPSDFVPVKASQLSDVVDPLGGLMLKPGGDPASVCRRTVPFYDGWSRLDLVLSPGGGEQDFQADGFSGKAIACNARIRPVSGYRTSSNGLKYLRERTIQLWFAEVRDSGIYAPVYVRIPTQVGPLTLTATRFAKG